MAQCGADDPPTIIHFLVETFDVPGGVVGNDEHAFRAMTNRGVDLHRIDTEGTVAVYRNNLTSWQRKRSCDGERHADAEAAEGARIHVSRRSKAGTGEAEQIAAVCNGYVVRLGESGNCIEDCARVDFAVRSHVLFLFVGRDRTHSLQVASA